MVKGGYVRFQSEESMGEHMKKSVLLAALATVCMVSSAQAQQSESGSDADTRGTFSKSGRGFIDPCRNPERPDDAVDFRGNRCPPRGIGEDLRGRYNPDQEVEDDTIMKRPGEPDDPLGRREDRGTTNQGLTGGDASSTGTGTLGNR